jgi:hypothetical protein
VRRAKPFFIRSIRRERVRQRFVHNDLWRRRQGVLGRVPVLDTNKHHAKRGSDCAGKPCLVPALVTTLIPPLIHPIAEKVHFRKHLCSFVHKIRISPVLLALTADRLMRGDYYIL